MAIEYSSIQGLERIGRGAIGTVYKVPGGGLDPKISQPLALKKYKKSALEGNAIAIGGHLKNLLRQRKELDKELRAILDQHTTWPMALVEEAGVPCGFIMKLIPDEFTFRYVDDLGEDSMLTNFDTVLDTDAHRQKMGMPLVNGTGRAKIAMDLLRVIWALHKAQIVVGDISPNNLLVAVDGANQAKSKVLVIDSDSFRVMTGSNPLKQQHTGGWQPPESLAAEEQRTTLLKNNGDKHEISRLGALVNTQNIKTDIYKICLAITRLYHSGDHRTLIRSSDSAHQGITKSFGKEFADLVENGLSENPSARPSAEALYLSFRGALEATRKKRLANV